MRKYKGIIRNMCVDVVIQSLLIYRLFDMENVIVNNACKFLPLLFSFLVIITLHSSITFYMAAFQPVLKARILSDRTLINGFLEFDSNKPLKIYHNITNTTLAILLILNGFIGSLGIYIMALLLLSSSNQNLKMLLPPKPDPLVYEKYKRKILSEISIN